MSKSVPHVISLMHSEPLRQVASHYTEDTNDLCVWLTLCFTQAWEVQRMKHTNGPMYAVVNEVMLQKYTDANPPRIYWKNCDVLSCEKLGISHDSDKECLVATIVILHSKNAKDFTQLTCKLPRCPHVMFDCIRTDCIKLSADRGMWPPKITCDSPFCCEDIILTSKKGLVRRGNAVYCHQTCAKLDEAAEAPSKAIEKFGVLRKLTKELEGLKQKHTAVREQLKTRRGKRQTS